MYKNVPMGLRFSLLHRSFQRHLDERLKEHELTGVQFCVLGQLSNLERRSDGEIYQKDLEKASRVTHPTMTEILKRLEKKEYIQCRQGSKDRRFKSISSTAKAAALRSEIEAVDDAVFRDLCHGLTPEQISTLVDICDIMLKNCEKGLGKCCD